jgi:DNA-binding response OmpR family regulator
LRDVPFRETGKELLLRLREEKLGKLQTPRAVPVVAVTAVSDIDVIEKINSAANLVIYKPVDPDDAVARMVDAGLLQRSAT